MSKSTLKTIPFNIPYNGTAAFTEIMATGFEPENLFSGPYAEKVRAYFMDACGAKEVILTCACTRALELVALLLELKPGDEVIVPSYTYVSSANAFELHGAHVRFCDSRADSPNLDIQHVESLITPRTRAVVAMHYAGFGADMDALVDLTRKHGLVLIEDAAQGVHAFYNNRPLGSFGDFAAFSFHETKNVSCGQGGALIINNPDYLERATVLKNVGTNRHRFLLGLEDKYTWVDSGSVFNLPEICCAYLYPQLVSVDAITEKRVQCWKYYFENLKLLAETGCFDLPEETPQHQHNGHIFYLVMKNKRERDDLLQHLKGHGVIATFHYAALHQSPYVVNKYGRQTPLPNAEKYSDQLLRLPLYDALSTSDQDYVIQCIKAYFEVQHAREEPVVQPKNKNSFTRNAP